MHETINEKIGVITVYDAYKHTTTLYSVKWQGKVHKITKVGYHHAVRDGRTLKHIFSVTSETLAFRLIFDSETLSWTLAEVSDGIAD
jgi:hypothetical protein